MGGLPDNDIQIGAATISFTIEDAPKYLGANFRAASISEGFYAIAYDFEGETIVSYRGTDKGGDFGLNYVGNSGELILTDAPLKSEDWNSGETNWLLDVIAPDQKAVFSVVSNFKKVVKEGDLRLHPLVARLLGNENLGDLGLSEDNQPTEEVS